MTGVRQDIRFALRQLARNPGFTAAAVLTLALGIAATTTVFSFVDAALLRPLPFAEPSRLFVMWNARPGNQSETLSYPNFADYRARASVFDRLALFRRSRFNVGSSESSERVRGALVTADFFRTVGVAPIQGRDFADGEDQPGRDGVVLVSEEFWRRMLGGDPAAVGRAIRLDGASASVVGVMPAGMAFPSNVDVWVPISREDRSLLESRGLQGYTAVGRLRDGTTAGQAQEQLATIAAGLAAEYPQHNAGWSVRLEPLQTSLSGSVRPTLLLLFGSAAVLLVVAAVNLASMLLARATTRQREVAVRRAVGAGDGRLIRQFVTESLVLAGLGGIVGVLAALWGVQALRAAWENPSGAPAAATVDWRVVSFAFLVTAGTALLFGLAPALRVTRAGVSEILRQGGGATTRLRRSARVLVAGELALALVLGIGGCLLVRSLLNVQAVDPGFDADRVLTARISLPEASHREPKQVVAFYRELLGEIERLPGVEAAGAADAMPLIPGGGSYGFTIQGQPTPPVQQWPVVAVASTTPDYFRALGMRVIAGRAFESRDDSSVPDVAVVNQTMARTYWPDRGPVGQRITFDSEQKHWIEIVGVVSDVRSEDLTRHAAPQMYLAHAQWGDRSMSLAVRAAGDPLRLIGPIRDITRRLSPEIPIAEPRTMEQAVVASIVPQRLRTAIFAGFAAMALALAAIGIYGVMAYLVSQREREIAVRMALGARRGDVVGGVLGHSLRLAAPGIVLGLAGALLSARVMRGFLYEVAPTDPVVLALVSLSVTALVAAAALVPARRAARTDPMAALRSE